jgi:type VI secretion system protein ImpK
MNDNQIEKNKTRLIDSFTEILTYAAYFKETSVSENPEFETVKNDIDELFKRSENIAKNSQIKNIEWKKGCFPVCALVDEIILCSDWNEKNNWRKNQLQLRYFKTTRAGDLFFDKLNKAESKQLREVFTYCLAMGFKGKYFSEDDFMTLSEIKTENILKYFSEDAYMNLPEVLFPEAYNKNVANQKKRSKVSFFLFILIFILLPPACTVGIYFFYNDKLNAIFNNLKFLW